MFHRALKGIGVPSHLYVYPGHAHGNWTLESHLMRANADIAWMGECNQLKIWRRLFRLLTLVLPWQSTTSTAASGRGRSRQ